MELEAPHGPAWVFCAVVVVIAVLPWLCERVRVPGIIGLLLGGLLIGQHGLGIVPEGDLVIPAIGHIGLLYLMFLAGVELDLAVLSRYRTTAVLFAVLTFAAPLALGVAAATVLDYGSAAALLVGSLCASHTLVTYPTVRARGLGSNGAVATAVGATVMTDTLALLVLAGVSSSATGSGGTGELVLQMGLGLTAVAAWCFGSCRAWDGCSSAASAGSARCASSSCSPRCCRPPSWRRSSRSRASSAPSSPASA